MYNSNYGAGYGSMGSMGSMGSYGSYGSSYGMNSTLGGMRNLQNNPQNNNQQPNPEQNESNYLLTQEKKSSSSISR
jgi:hypothetical protein